jgi:hypothetical protein
LSAPGAGGRSLAGIVFRIVLFVLVLVAIVVAIINVVTGKQGADELNLIRPREHGPIHSCTTWAHSVSEQRFLFGKGDGGRCAHASASARC